MTELNPILLARNQFAANISFPSLFPTITIALGWILLGMKLGTHINVPDAVGSGLTRASDAGLSV